MRYSPAIGLESGAEVFVDFKTEDVAARVLELAGEGAHATVVVPSTKEAFKVAPTLVRNMGQIIWVDLPPNDMELPISATLCAGRALSIKGSSVGREEQMAELLQLALHGVITPAIEVFDFEETPNLINKIKDDTIVG